jgi:hypothetical protein
MHYRLAWYASKSNFLGGPGSRTERNNWDAGSNIYKQADLVFNLGLLCFYGGYKAWMRGPGTVIGREALASVPLGTGDSVPSNVFPNK